MSSAAAERYRADGYVVVRQVMSAAELGPYAAAVREASDRFAEPRGRDTYGRAFVQTFNAWERDERVRQLVLSPRLASVAAALMGAPAVRIFCDEILIKPPGAGHTPWHQDHSAAPFDTDQGIALWIPLHDVTKEMGSLRFARGSHRFGEVGPYDISDETDAAFEALVQREALAVDDLCDLSLGDVSCHHAWSIHAAHANGSRLERAALVIHYFADGALLGTPNNPTRSRLLEWLAPGRRPGDRAEGPRFPLVPC